MEGTQIMPCLTRREQDIVFVLCVNHGIKEFCIIWGDEPRCYHAYVEGKITKTQRAWLVAAIEGIQAACRWGY